MEKSHIKQIAIDQKEELGNLVKRERIIPREFLQDYKKIYLPI